MKWQNIKGKDLYKLTDKLSLESAPSKRNPHPVYWYKLDGIKVLRIKFPNIHGGSGAISTGFLKQIRNSLKLRNREFEDLVECPLTADEYENIVRTKMDNWRRD